MLGIEQARFDISEPRIHQAAAALPRHRLDRAGADEWHRTQKLATWRHWLPRRIVRQPDIATRELADELAGDDDIVIGVSVWNQLQREDQSRKEPSGHQAG